MKINAHDSAARWRLRSTSQASPEAAPLAPDQSLSNKRYWSSSGVGGSNQLIHKSSCVCLVVAVPYDAGHPFVGRQTQGGRIVLKLFGQRRLARAGQTTYQMEGWHRAYPGSLPSPSVACVRLGTSTRRLNVSTFSLLWFVAIVSTYTTPLSPLEAVRTLRIVLLV